MNSVKAKWAQENAKSINLIDVRSPLEFQDGHVDGAKNIPMAGLMFNTNEFLKKDETYYLMCWSGNRSYATYQDLESKGYKVVQVEGGFSALK